MEKWEAHAAETEQANKNDVVEGKRGTLQTIPVLADKGILRKLACCRSLSFCWVGERNGRKMYAQNKHFPFWVNFHNILVLLLLLHNVRQRSRSPHPGLLILWQGCRTSSLLFLWCPAVESWPGMRWGKRRLWQLVLPYFPACHFSPCQGTCYQRDVLSELLQLFNRHRPTWSVKSHPGVVTLCIMTMCCRVKKPPVDHTGQPTGVPGWSQALAECQVLGQAGCCVRLRGFHSLQTAWVAMLLVVTWHRKSPTCSCARRSQLSQNSTLNIKRSIYTH